MSTITRTSDFTVTWSQKTHTDDCATKKEYDMWLWVGDDEFARYLDSHGSTLNSFVNTTGNCIGWYVEETPESEMVAKEVLQGGVYYAIKNPNYKELECDCGGEVVVHDLSSGFGTDEFITATKEK
jgi:hypothetical protein